ncbi:MAG: RNA-guided endonuclease InsQ/TnpB family protein [Syntrophobacteraceae bacterium]
MSSFRFESGLSGHTLLLGTKTNPVGELKFKAHAEYELPASITISRHGGKWYVSFTQEVPGIESSEADLIAHFGAMTPEDLEPLTLGADCGVVVPLATSDGASYGFSEAQKKRLQKKEARRKRYERRMARRQKGSNRWKRAALAVARIHAHAGNVRDDFAHKTSRKLVDSTGEVFVFENLKVKNMTKAPAPKQDENGRYVQNGAAAKAELNKAILDSAWGKVRQFATYKALRRGKLVIVIPPNGTSQECSRCGHTHPDNRKTQAEFVCQCCGLTMNADENASLVIKKRGIRDLLEGKIVVREKKRTMRLKDKKKAPIGWEPAEFTRGEMSVRRSSGKSRGAQLSVNREETPTTNAHAV